MKGTRTVRSIRLEDNRWRVSTSLPVRWQMDGVPGWYEYPTILVLEEAFLASSDRFSSLYVIITCIASCHYGRPRLDSGPGECVWNLTMIVT